MSDGLGEEKTVSVRRVFDGRLLKVDAIDVELPDGRRSVREVVRHPGAVVVLLRDADGAFVLVRQYRKAAEKVLLEVIAGTLEAGEEPVECARREAAEEAGYVVSKIEKLGTIYPAPGYTSEKLHIFLAEGREGLSDHRPDEDENIERVCLSEAEIDAMLKAGTIEDAKTLAAWLMYRTREAK